MTIAPSDLEKSSSAFDRALCRGRDRYGRSIGLCRPNGEDPGAAMVSTGMAWAFTRYSSDLASLSARAVTQSRHAPRDHFALGELFSSIATRIPRISCSCMNGLFKRGTLTAVPGGSSA